MQARAKRYGKTRKRRNKYLLRLLTTCVNGEYERDVRSRNGRWKELSDKGATKKSPNVKSPKLKLGLRVVLTARRRL